MRKAFAILTALLAAPMLSLAGEADLVVPEGMKDSTILYWGFLITLAGMLFGLYQFVKVRKLRAHRSMLDVAQVIFETSKTYLLRQGRFLVILFIFIGAAVGFYFGFLSEGFGLGGVLMILGWTVVG
ncbi:MAG: sodium-translocating pyrophosphatase, partial [Bacteroidales bacterium]|nr:sodium-translocating pyrophosphatase [Bacteroidales bacterium]